MNNKRTGIKAAGTILNNGKKEYINYLVIMNSDIMDKYITINKIIGNKEVNNEDLINEINKLNNKNNIVFKEFPKKYLQNTFSKHWDENVEKEFYKEYSIDNFIYMINPPFEGDILSINKLVYGLKKVDEILL